jgi:hypothetical protein
MCRLRIAQSASHDANRVSGGSNECRSRRGELPHDQGVYPEGHAPTCKRPVENHQ